VSGDPDNALSRRRASTSFSLIGGHPSGVHLRRTFRTMSESSASGGSLATAMMSRASWGSAVTPPQQASRTPQDHCGRQRLQRPRRSRILNRTRKWRYGAVVIHREDGPRIKNPRKPPTIKKTILSPLVVRRPRGPDKPRRSWRRHERRGTTVPYNLHTDRAPLQVTGLAC
jgi:hypothetical protein